MHQIHIYQKFSIHIPFQETYPSSKRKRICNTSEYGFTAAFSDYATIQHNTSVTSHSHKYKNYSYMSVYATNVKELITMPLHHRWNTKLHSYIDIAPFVTTTHKL
jgi:hypothetical protein